MKTLLKILVVAVGIYSTSATALTAQECKDKGGTWSQIVGAFGKCTIALTAVKTKPAGIDVKNITKKQCEDLGGTVTVDGCVIMTKNLVKDAPPPSAKQ